MNRLLPMLTAGFLVLLLATTCPAQPVEIPFDQSGTVPSDFPNYGWGTQALSGTPGVHTGAAGGFWNPALWGMMREWEAAFSWNDRNINDKRLDNWGLFLGGKGLGFGVRRNNFRTALLDDSARIIGFRGRRIDDYEFGFGNGNRELSVGMAYGWSRGGGDPFPRDHRLTTGAIYRPWPYLSAGTAIALGLNRGDYRGLFDLGVRPMGCHRLTLFGDAAAGRYDSPTTLQWGAGLEIQPLDGLRIAGKVSKTDAFTQDKTYSLGLGLSFDGLGFSAVPHYDQDNHRLSTSYLVRVGEQAPTFDTRRIKKNDHHVLSMSLKGTLTYQKSRWFSKDKTTLWEMISLIEKAKADPDVGGIALNLSGFEAPREPLWEVREKLKEFKSAGKKVYIYFDEAGMSTYYFASVADYLWMDPQGRMLVPGYVAGRTFWKNFLTKIGLGVEEWRYFDYKSAFETFARTNMSEKDKEQRLALIEDFYSEWQKEISSARDLTAEQLRAAVDTGGIFMPEEALAAGLIDTIGTWDDAKDFIKTLRSKEPEFITREELRSTIFADPVWGEPPKIAVVYAIGECAMDEGIKGRYTSRLLRKLANSKEVKAVVLRADSPGGDVLASDLVARQMTEVSKKKPMIVSQGGVAASGGYWISMNGDRIFTSPLTITGSIGVIGGWVWNERFSEKSGFTSDHVKVGDHAELGFGVTLPLIGMQIPDRNLNDYEKGRVERLLKTVYHDFTNLVGKARELETTYVDSVGQGRVWTGTRAISLKLCDEIGTMDQAIDYAREKSRLRRRYEVIEYPRRGLIDFGRSNPTVSTLWRALTPDSWATIPEAKEDYELTVIKRMAQNPGQPLLLTDPADIPAEARP